MHLFVNKREKSYVKSYLNLNPSRARVSINIFQFFYLNLFLLYLGTF